MHSIRDMIDTIRCSATSYATRNGLKFMSLTATCRAAGRPAASTETRRLADLIRNALAVKASRRHHN